MTGRVKSGVNMEQKGGSSSCHVPSVFYLHSHLCTHTCHKEACKGVLCVYFQIVYMA